MALRPGERAPNEGRGADMLAAPGAAVGTMGPAETDPDGDEHERDARHWGKAVVCQGVDCGLGQVRYEEEQGPRGVEGRAFDEDAQRSLYVFLQSCGPRCRLMGSTCLNFRPARDVADPSKGTVGCRNFVGDHA